MKKNDTVEKILNEGLQRLTSMSQKEQTAVALWSKAMLERYNQILDEHPAMLKSPKMLPCSKQEMKLAIKVALLPHVARNAHERIQQLKHNYISLAYFQHVDPQDRQNFSRGGGEADRRSNAAAYPSYQKYLDLALAEQNSLLDEIDAFVSGIKKLKA
jgi:hypothetical protein